MNKKQQLVSDALRRVLAFLQAWAHVLIGVTDTGAHRALSETAEKLSELSQQQDSTGLQRSAELGAQRKARARVRDDWMLPIVRLATARSAQFPTLADITLPALRLNNAQFLGKAREIVAAVANHREAFVDTLPADFVEQCTKAIDAFEAAVSDRERAIANRMGATALVGTGVVQGKAMIGVIDALVLPRIEGYPGIQADWARTKRLVQRGMATPATPGAAAGAKPSASASTAVEGKESSGPTVQVEATPTDAENPAASI